MIYDEVGSGGSTAAGCIVVGMLHPSVTTFGIGDTVYNVQKARRGVLEKVMIKSIRAVTSRRTRGVNRVLYVDTFNGLWNERDLVPFGTAMALAEVYYMNLMNAAAQLASC